MSREPDDAVRKRGCFVRLILLPFTVIAIIWPLAFYWYGGQLQDVRGFLRNHGMGVGAATVVTIVVVLFFHHQIRARWIRFRRGER